MYNGKSIALPFNFSILKWAADTRQILDNAQLPSSVGFYNIYGTSFDSPYDVCYGSETSPIADLSEICHTMPEYTYVDGDGTVPAESAKADGFAAVARVAVKSAHRELLKDKIVLQLLKQWLGVSDNSQHSMSSSKVMDVSVEPIPIELATRDLL
ncbi:putative Phospholipase A(1) LCAT3 [Cocos nucifera]|nr:putative Phospholipase A(1) LCAT3 [Cocos nucifera]